SGSRDREAREIRPEELDSEPFVADRERDASLLAPRAPHLAHARKTTEFHRGGLMVAFSAMQSRTFAIGDIHGEPDHLKKLFSRLPALESTDTVVFLGDYLDRGPNSRGVIDFVKSFPSQTKAKVVALRGNHEDAWLRVCKKGWDEFVLPPGNGCLAAMRSYTGGPAPKEGEKPAIDELMELTTG